MPEREKLLFVCSQNRIRSLTAEKLFERDTRYDVRSVGTEHDARIRVNGGHIGWADRIFVMEKRHRDRLRQKFGDVLAGKPVIVLYIPDEYEALAEDLFEILRARLAPHLDPPEEGGA